jgi:hypothetical protein
MSDLWRSIDLFLADTLSALEVDDEIRSGVVRFASSGGEFVRRIRVVGHVEHSEGWRKWSVAYLVGPPGSPPRLTAQRRATLTSLV